MSSKLSPQELDNLSKLLAKLDPGFLPAPIFYQITRLSVTAIIEVVPLRNNGDNIEVLLTKRSSDDPYWANLLHTPGTVLLPTDSKGGYTDAFERIIQNELGLVGYKNEPKFSGTVFRDVKRGAELSQIFWIEIDEAVVNGKFYNVNDLPDNIVNTQLELIKLASNDFKRHKETEN